MHIKICITSVLQDTIPSAKAVCNTSFLCSHLVVMVLYYGCFW